jgi:hypothetical protein
MARTQMNTSEQFYCDCGQIVLLSTSIEHTVGQYLTIITTNGDALDIFTTEDKFARKTFEYKIRLIEKLCETKNINSTTKTRLIKALRDIKSSRNSVGHWGASYDQNSNQFKLQDLKSSLLDEHCLDANKTIKEVQNNYFIAYRELSNFYNELINSKSLQLGTPHNLKKNVKADK